MFYFNKTSLETSAIAPDNGCMTVK